MESSEEVEENRGILSKIEEDQQQEPERVFDKMGRR
jgi:hypothetical protein